MLIDDVVLEEVPGDTEVPENNLVINGDFEQGTAGWRGSSVVSENLEDKRSGSAAMQFVDDSEAAGYHVSQKIDVEAGKTYKLMLWTKIKEGTGGYVGVFGLGTGIDVIQSLAQTEGWALNTIVVTVPEGVTQISIEIGSHKNQVVTFLVDDVAFFETTVDVPVETDPTTPTATETPDGNLPINGGFEAGL